MAVTPRKVEADVEVNDRGELVVPADELGELAVPGQRLHVTVSPPAPRGPRRASKEHVRRARRQSKATHPGRNQRIVT
jgi:hypothetical protein